MLENWKNHRDWCFSDSTYPSVLLRVSVSSLTIEQSQESNVNSFLINTKNLSIHHMQEECIHTYVHTSDHVQTSTHYYCIWHVNQQYIHIICIYIYKNIYMYIFIYTLYKYTTMHVYVYVYAYVIISICICMCICVTYIHLHDVGHLRVATGPYSSTAGLAP